MAAKTRQIGCTQEGFGAKTGGYKWARLIDLIRYKSRFIYWNIGGDGTYLRTSGLIETSEIPILGLNTDPARSTGMLCN